MSNQFVGKKLLVVGGTSGMGLQTARMVLAQGGGAVIVGNRAEKTEAARRELAALGAVAALTADRHAAGCRRSDHLPAVGQGELGHRRDLGCGRRRDGRPQLTTHFFNQE